MADLIDRLTFGESVTGRPKISSHQFSGYLILYALGVIGKAEIDTAWDLQGTEQAQAQEVADSINAAVGADGKHRQVDRIDAVNMLLDARDSRYVTGETIDKVKVKADAGF